MWLNKRIIGIRLKLSGRAQHVVPATEEGAVTKDSACPKTLLWNLPCLRPCIKNFLGQVLHVFLKVCWICLLGNIFDCFHTHSGISHILCPCTQVFGLFIDFFVLLMSFTENQKFYPKYVQPIPSPLHIGLPLHATF